MAAKPRALIWAAVSTLPQADEDKFSIPVQIDDAKRLCDRYGWEVTDTLVVPGHSRSYRDLKTLAEHARPMTDAFDKLLEHLHDKDFDIFICRDANRIARYASLLHWVAETIIEDCGANIYSMHDALLVTEENVDMWVTMKGYTVRSEIRSLVKAAAEGLKKRAERGLPSQSIMFSHLLIRDERLKPVKMVVDESKRRLFNDLYALIVEEQLPFNGIEMVLFERFGHANKKGQPYGNNRMYNFLYHPHTWGATAYGFYQKKYRQVRDYGLWVFDESEPLPEEVVIHRNTTQPVYTGEQAELLKAELRRRKAVFGGRRPKTTHEFSGLFMCGSCGYGMNADSQYAWKKRSDVVRRKSKSSSFRCPNAVGGFQWRPKCDQPNVKIKVLREYVDGLLRRLIETQDYSLLLSDGNLNQEQEIDRELTELGTALDNLIVSQMTAHAATRDAYARKIDAVGERVEILKKLKREIHTRNARHEEGLSSATAAVKSIAEVIDHFWELEPVEINQYLSRLLGKQKIVVLGDQIIGIHAPPPRQRRKPI